jgi:hypothetical protein
MSAVERNLPLVSESGKEETTMKGLRKALLLAAVLAAPACASSGANASRQEEQASVVVDNRALLDHTIYVLRGSQRVRLGIATGLTKTKLTIPSGVILGATTLRFLADPIGGTRNPVSEEINIVPGDEIGLTIPPA